MLEDRLRVWNPWWSGGQVPSDLVGVPRDALRQLVGALEVRHVKDLVGVRRSGKTTLMVQLVAHLLKEGSDPRSITLANFDDPVLRDAGFEALETAIGTLAPGTTHLLVDEVQEKPGWESWIRTLYDTRRFAQIIVTGSSASVLRGDVARTLTGRHVSLRVRPFSFPEYARATGLPDASPDAVGAERVAILSRLERFLHEGGMPEAVGQEPFRRQQILVALFGDLVERDVAARHGLSGPLALRVASTLARAAGKPVSLRRVASAVGTSVETVARYADHLVEANLFLETRYFTAKEHPPVHAARKYYLVDCGLYETVAGNPGRGRLAETAVFHALSARSDEAVADGPWFWTEPGRADVDFVLGTPPRPEAVVQVTVGMSRPDVAQRERRSMERAIETLRPQSALVVTWTEEGTEAWAGREVRLVPLWRFLLKPGAYL